MVKYFVAAALYIITITILIIVGTKFKNQFTIITYPYFMRSMTVVITVPFNLLMSVYAFIFLFDNGIIPGYLRVFYYNSVSALVYMILLLVERFIVQTIIVLGWKNNLRRELFSNLELYENRIEELPHDSEYYNEAVYALDYIYRSLIAKAKARGEKDYLNEYMERHADLVNRVSAVRK